MRCVTLDVNGFASLGKYRLLGEVRKHDDQCASILTRSLVREASGTHMNSIHTGDKSIGAVYIKLTLIEVEQMTINLEMTAVSSARNQNQGEKKKEV